MPVESLIVSPELLRSYAEYDRQVTIQNYRVGCVLGIVFMPAGALLDFVVYRDFTWFFFKLRVICSALLAAVYFLLKTPWGIRNYRVLGLVEVALPLLFISGMIFITNGSSSPYYAGLNLVLMGAGVVLRWTLEDSIGVLVLALGMYLSACLLHGGVQGGAFPMFFNNLYFLFVTGVFIITGNYFYSRIRFREFSLRYELDRSRSLVEETNRKLVEMDQVKSRFFANISHELRTPLTLLIAPLEALRQERKSWMEEADIELLNTMHANGMRLLKLINDLLDLVRLESGKMQVKAEKFDGASFFQGLANAVRQVAKDKRLHLGTSIAPDLSELVADRDKLEKIVLNLLFNAIKFTPSAGSVTLHARRSEGNLVIQIEDTGMGISEQQLPHVFDRFWQADTSSQRKYQGAGIGLALVKELAEVQGGNVEVKSALDKGTTMTVRIPLREGEAGADSATPSPEPEKLETGIKDEWIANLYRRAELFPSMSPLRDTIRPEEQSFSKRRETILVADDEPDMLRFLNSQLSRHYQVIEAVDGEQAFQKATQFQPDVVLLDMMMPEKDGLQVCRELRSKTGTQNIPIILLTARADEETKLAALAAGASDFLSKPFSSTELHVRVRNLVESHQFQRHLAGQNRKLEATLEQLKETETQLVQSEKLASLGRMSAGIIHEINNPLNYAKLGLRSLHRVAERVPTEEQAEYRDTLKDIEEGLDRVVRIVSDLRSFTHPREGLQEEVSLDKITELGLRFLSHEWRDQVKIEKTIDTELSIPGNSNQLVQVLVNLLQNALDAIKHKGMPEGEGSIRISGQKENGSVVLRIRDNGAGISSEDLGKIFEPFFTTKDVGQGMGLGLSICYRIIREHGGVIRAQSEKGQFCEFILEFPLASESPNFN